MNHKQLTLANFDYVLCYDVNEPQNSFGIGATDWEELPAVTIDMRTTFKNAENSTIRAHLIKMKDEVLRIIRANIEDPDSDFKLVTVTALRDFSDRSIGVGRKLVDVELRRYC